MVEHDVKLRIVESASALRTISKDTVIILSFWNKKGNIFKGIHTVAVEYKKNKYIAYNRFDTISGTLAYDSIESVIGSGKLIVGYIVTAGIESRWRK